jgi:hypothetical protein
MSTAASYGGAAAAAAAANSRREEEEMTPYPPGDPIADWEFKILRSATAAFRRPERLRAILEEEARAGWTLLEKFDDGRIRLKRPASARQLDGKLDFDPYRTHVGPSEGRIVALVLGVFLGTFLLLGLLLAYLNR